jgi:glycerophosphoryl diester phosphodiesterase
VLRIAHRGYAALGAANRLETISQALKLGCDVVEVDVRRRADGLLVCDHDNADAPQAPLLHDALALIATSSAGANLDLKEATITAQVARTVRQTDMLARTTCTGAVWPALRRLARDEPEMRVGLTVPRRSRPVPAWVVSLLVPAGRRRLAARAPSLLRSRRIRLLTVFHPLVDARVCTAVHGAGGEVWCWTVDDPVELSRLEAAGVDGVCSDHPTSHGLLG